MASFRIFWLLVISSTVISSTLVCSQTAVQTGAAVTFADDFPGSQPEHYSIRVQSDGSVRYKSSGRASPDANPDDNDSFDFNFTLDAETLEKTFALAAKAGYFQNDVASHRKGLAFTGKKTLSYDDARRSTESSYNFSDIPAVQELTTLMQSLSATLEFGHRLDYYRRYQKLALDDELKHMEEMAHDHQLIEISAIRPILDQIVADPSLMNVSRARAQRLLQNSSGR